MRPIFRHNRRLFADASRLIYDISLGFYCETAGKPLLSCMVIAHHTFGICSAGIHTFTSSFQRVASMRRVHDSTPPSPAASRWWKSSGVA